MQLDQILSSNNNDNRKNTESGNNVKDILLKYVHFFWLFALILALAILAAWTHLRYTTPMYGVGGTLLIRNDNSNRGKGGAEDMFADIALFQSSTNKQNEIEILKSRSMMERVVKELGLNVSYYVIGNVKTNNIYGEQPFVLELVKLTDSLTGFGLKIHFSEDMSKFTLEGNTKEFYSGQIFQIPQGSFIIRLKNSTYSKSTFRDFQVQYRPTRNVASSYSSGLQVKPANDLSNVLSLSYITDNPRLGADIINRLVVEYNGAGVEDKNEINRKIITFIDDRLELVANQLNNVESDLQQFKVNKQIIDLNTQAALYFQNLSELDKEIQTQQIQMQVAEIVENYLRDPSKKGQLVPSTLGLTDPTLLELTTGYNLLVAKRQTELQTGATQDNPVIKNLDDDIEDLRKKMLTSISNIKTVFRTSINSLQTKAGTVKSEVSSIPEKERQSREKLRQQEIKQNLYLYLLQKKEEAAIAQASTIATSKVIDEALPNYARVSPVPMKVYTIAILVGLLLPVIIIYIIELLNDKVTTKSDVTKVTDAPILGEIGHSVDNKVLLFPQKSRTVVAEQFRILRTNLKFILGGKQETPTILITSSFSGEGKSYVSINLGATLALSGKRTVILEFDLRKPKIMEGVEMAKGYGLTNYLVGSGKMQDLPKPVPQIENLFVIPCGPVPPNPSEILLTAGISELFTWLKKEFDVIVIDTAPVGLVSDALSLSQYADCCLYVIRQRHTFKRQLNFINDLYKDKKLPQMGLLVNDVITQGSRGYYGYGGGSYSYGYGYGYGKNGQDYYSNEEVGFWKKLWKRSKK